MKKLLSILLAAAMMLTVMGLMAACGEESSDTDSTPVSSAAGNSDVDAGNSDVSSDAGASSNPFPAVLTNIVALPIDSLNLTGTAWEFSGGLYDGVDMDQDDAQAFLTGAGGSFQFLFPEDGKVKGISGQNEDLGTYTVVADGYFLEMQFSGGKYYVAFTMVEDNVVMIAVNEGQNDLAVYLTVMEG